MLKNYLKIALRNLLRNKTFSFINIFGLAIGLAACLIIVQYVSFELSYDDFHPDVENTYRLRLDRTRNGKLDKSSGTAPGMGVVLKENLPEVKNFLRLKNMDYMTNTLQYEDNTFNQENLFFADSSFFSFFNFPVVKEIGKHQFQEPNTAYLTQTIASKLFGKEDPVGKVFSLSNEYGKSSYKILGVIKDLPKNTHLKIDVLLSYASLINIDPSAKETLGWNSFHTYIKLQPGVSPKTLEAKANSLARKLLASDLKEYNYKISYLLQPVKDIHLYEERLRQDYEVKGSRKTIYALVIVAFFIITIAYFNYINLSTARAMERAKEVGIRKVVGSGKCQLIFQFLTESFLLNLIALILAVIIVKLSLPYFNQLTNKDFSFYFLFQSDIWLVFSLVLLTGALAAGIYPAFVLSSYKPIVVLKGKVTGSAKGALLRKSLVVAQFAASVILIAGTMAVYQQIQYMRNKELGFDVEQTLVLRAPYAANDKFNVLKETLLQNKSIQHVTSSMSIPGREITRVNNIFRVSDTNGGQLNSYSMHFHSIDEEFLDTYNINIIAGRNFSSARKTDQSGIILSETALKSLGFKSPEEAIGQKLREYEDDFTIIGVTKDFHQLSLKAELLPIVFLFQETNNIFYSVKIANNDFSELKTTISTIESKWKSIFPGAPFDYFFLDEFFNNQYKSDQQLGKIFLLFASLAIFIACLGLFGLAAFSTLQRTKEIGVRKVLGASTSGIVALMSRDFIKLILIANLFAWPLIYLIIEKWLENYPYRITINPLNFAVPALLVLVIALATVSYQAMKAAVVDPVKSLRSE